MFLRDYMRTTAPSLCSCAKWSQDCFWKLQFRYCLELKVDAERQFSGGQYSLPARSNSRCKSEALHSCWVCPVPKTWDPPWPSS